MAGDLQGMRQRAGGIDERYERARERYRQTQQASLDRRAKQKQEEERLRQERALEAQRIQAQKDRDNRQNQADMTQTAMRATAAADSQAADFRYSQKLADQQQRGIRKRDELLAGYESAQARQQAQDQRDRDFRQFGYSMSENQQQFGNQLERDAIQQGYSIDRAKLDQGNTLQRDAFQYGLDTRRAQQDQRNTLQREAFQSQLQSRRDAQLNQYDAEQQQRQFDLQSRRDAVQFRNDITQQRMEQQFVQQNQYQREAADIAARWQEQVQRAKAAGLDFSPQQQKEIQEMDAAFRKHVLNGDFDEVTKMRAMVEHQKKLAAIIPEQKVVMPQQRFEQSLVKNPETGELMIEIQDPRGFATYEPLSSGQGDMAKFQQQQQEKAAQAQEKQAAMQREARFERAKAFDSLVEKLESKINPATTEPVYPDRQSVIEAAKQQFAIQEDYYRKEYGLEAHPEYQNEARRVQQQQQQMLNKSQKTANPWQRMLDQSPGGSQRPAQSPLPKTVTSSNIDSQIERATKSNDSETAAALQAFKIITERHKGAPPRGSQDMESLIEAMTYLRDHGVKVEVDQDVNTDYKGEYYYPF